MSFQFPANTLAYIHPPRLRQSGKKKKKINIHVKRGKKDDMKLALLKLKSIVQSEQTDSPGPSRQINDSESDKGSVGPE